MNEEACVFCEIVRDRPKTVVWEDEQTVAFMDLRQFHAGHLLVIPRKHVPDIRAADSETAAALIQTVIRMAHAVDAAYPSDGLNIWHSAGQGANQEVPHLHIHVHPRFKSDGFFSVYPTPPTNTPVGELEVRAQRIRERIDGSAA